MYICKKCNYSTKLKNNYNQHINTKKHMLKNDSSRDSNSNNDSDSSRDSNDDNSTDSNSDNSTDSSNDSSRDSNDDNLTNSNDDSSRDSDNDNFTNSSHDNNSIKSNDSMKIEKYNINLKYIVKNYENKMNDILKTQIIELLFETAKILDQQLTDKNSKNITKEIMYSVTEFVKNQNYKTRTETNTKKFIRTLNNQIFMSDIYNKIIIEEKDKRLKEKDEFLKFALVNSKKPEKMNGLNYVIKNYNDAPILKKINKNDADELLKNSINKKYHQNISEHIVDIFEQNKFIEFIGNIIKDEYLLPNKPEQQKFWNTDITRSTYVVRSFDNINKKTKWIRDINGIKICNDIIIPLLEKVKSIFKSHVNDTNKNNNKKLSISMTKIIDLIETKKLEKQILNYISQFFYIKS